MNSTIAALTDICRIVAAVLLVRQLPPACLGAVVACLRDNGGEMLAECLIGVVPFEVQSE